MSRDESRRLADILEAIEAIRTHRRDPDGSAESVVQDAVLYRLVVIGEAAARISDATRAAAPQIEWHALIALRNRLAHSYWRIGMELIDEIVQNELAPLEDAARQLLDREHDE